MKYCCANCGCFASFGDVELLDSGSTVVCNYCGKKNVFEIFTPIEYKKRWEPFLKKGGVE